MKRFNPFVLLLGMLLGVAERTQKIIPEQGRDTTLKGAAIIGLMLGIMIAIVVGISLYPIISAVVNNSTATGNDRTLLNLIPTLFTIFLMLIIVSAFGYLGGRMGPE